MSIDGLSLLVGFSAGVVVGIAALTVIAVMFGGK